MRLYTYIIVLVSCLMGVLLLLLLLLLLYRSECDASGVDRYLHVFCHLHLPIPPKLHPSFLLDGYQPFRVRISNGLLPSPIDDLFLRLVPLRHHPLLDST